MSLIPPLAINLLAGGGNCPALEEAIKRGGPLAIGGAETISGPLGGALAVCPLLC